jgi:hypothetical protein
MFDQLINERHSAGKVSTRIPGYFQPPWVISAVKGNLKLPNEQQFGKQNLAVPWPHWRTN